MIDVTNLKEMPECPNCTPLNPGQRIFPVGGEDVKSIVLPV